MPKIKKAYLVGGGVASLATAVYLIRDGGVAGKNITIIDEGKLLGGALDSTLQRDGSHLMRGGRMFEEHYGCTYDLLSEIPSLDNEGRSVKDEILIFNKKHRTYSQARLVKNGKKLDMKSLGLSDKDRADFVRLLATPEKLIENKRIDEWFDESFFKTNFWYFYCTTFAFETWHSLIELKRYFLRFMHLFPGDGLRHLTGVWRTPLNQYDSIVMPLEKWLTEKGVKFIKEAKVTDVKFEDDDNKKRVVEIIYTKGNKNEKISLVKGDICTVTIGSMTADSSVGSMTEAPRLETGKKDGAWKLWEKIAKESKEFGRPSVFDSHVDDSKWESFSMTFNNSLFFDLLEEYSGNEAGTGGLVTFTDSNWLMSIVLAHQPYFRGQPKNVNVCWGYGLFPDAIGNYVNKKMSECTGEEIMIELLGHLKFKKHQKEIIESCNNVPAMMPYITSQFLVRKEGDRPEVVPKNSANFAFLGQYVEIPDDCVFTVEYSVRAAQIAVQELLGLKNIVTPLYKGHHNPKVMYDAYKTLHE